MPRLLKHPHEQSYLCPVRCFACHRPIQNAMTVYGHLLRKGFTLIQALEGCGLENQGPFLSKDESKGAPTPPATCCRGIVMTMFDYSEQHARYKQTIAWGEGPKSVGLNVAPPAVPPLFKKASPSPVVSLSTESKSNTL